MLQNLFIFFCLIYTSGASFAGEVSPPNEPDPVEKRRQSSEKIRQRKEERIRKAVRDRHDRKEMIQAGSALATTLGAGAATIWASSNTGLTLVLGNTLMQRLQHDLPFLLSKLTPKGWFISEKNEYQQLLYQLEEDFEVKRSHLSVFNEQVIAKTISDMQANIDSYMPGYTYMGFLIQTGFKKLGGLLSLPVNTIEMNDQNAIFSSLESYLSTFDHSVRTEISKLAFRMMTQAEREGQNSLPKASYLFVGEAGTGKTTTAEAIAEAYGIPYCRINLGSMKLTDLFGSVERDTIVIGKLAKCMIEPDSGIPGTNPLIFIDEIHDLLNSSHPDSGQLYTLLKNLSDPDQKEVDDIALGAKIDLSKVTFILGSNAKPDRQKDISNALNSRLITIEFPSLTQEQKKVVANRTFPELSKRYSYPGSPQDEQAVQDILSADHEPGARILKKVLEDYVLHQAAFGQGRIDAAPFNIEESFFRNGSQSQSNGT